MKKTIKIFILFILMSSNSFGQETSIDLDKFDELKVFDQITLILVKSDQNKAIISGKDQDEVAIVNKDGRLKVRMEVDNLFDGKETKVTLYHAEDLSLIDVNENAKITYEGLLTANYLTLKAQEGGEIHATVKTKNLNIKAISGGKIFLQGDAPNQEVVIRTGGEYMAKTLNSNQTDVTVFAGGKAYIRTTEYIEANVTAGGLIEIFGNPEVVKEDKTLGGSIVIRK